LATAQRALCQAEFRIEWQHWLNLYQVSSASARRGQWRAISSTLIGRNTVASACA
jgi:hypothetical protein